MAEVKWHGAEVINTVSNKLEVAIMKAVLIVEADAKKMCPVDTGRLRASITHEVLKLADDIYQGRIGTNVEYAEYVELGTDKMPAQPYLRPALENNRDKIEKLIRAAL